MQIKFICGPICRLALRVAGLAVVLMVLALIASASASAQTTGGTLLGKVTDTTGGVIPGASVTIKNTATGITRALLTNEIGGYQAPNLQPGIYEITVAMPSFTVNSKQNIQLTVGGELVLDFQLHPEGGAQTVSVVSDDPSVDLAVSTVSREVDGTTIRELPLNGRDWTQLAALQPGISTIAGGGGAGRDGSGTKMTISGARPTENDFRLDGVSVNDNSNSTPGSILGTNMGVEAVREFSVVSNNYSAEYGRATGGVINAVTKSGTNDIHGTLFYFGRNSAADARNFFDPSTKPSFRRHQFGASGGGPIRRNRTFWFANFEGLNQFLGTTAITNTLSAPARLGQLSTGTVSIDPSIARIFPLMPLPNGSLLGAGDTGQFITARNTPSTGRYILGKIDHKVSNTGSLSGTYYFDNAKSDSPDGFLVKRTADTSRKQMTALSYTHIVSPSVLSVSGIGFSRSATNSGVITKVMNPLLEDPSLGFISGLNIGAISVPGISFTGNGPGATNITSLIFNSYQAHQDLYVTMGAHSLKMGINLERMQYNFDIPQLNGGQFTFGSLSDFLINRPSSFAGLYPGSDTRRGLRQTLLAGYLQDDFRWKSNFTINLGLRYEYLTIPAEVNGKVALLHNPTDPVVKVGGPILDHNPTLRNFGPRVGVVWDPFKDGKTSIRSGFGVFDSLPLLWLFDTPLDRSTPLFNQGVTTAPPLGSFPGGAFPLLQIQNLRTAYVDPNPPRAYSLKWDLDLQRQISGWIAEAGYAGSRGIHLPLVERNMNVAMPVQTPTGWIVPAGSKRLNPNFSAINTTDTWNADSYYHGLQLSLKRSWRQSVQVQESFTWSKSIDTASSQGSTNATAGYSSSVAVVTPFLPGLNRGLSDFDVPYNSVTSVVFAFPFGRGLHGAMATAFKGWELSSIYKVQSGTPFSVVLNSDRAGTLTDTTGTGLGQRPNLVVGEACQTLTNPGDPNNFIKTACFTFPDKGTLGNLGRNTMRKSGISNLDLSLSKRLNHSENVNSQIRLELFNALNHTNFGAPNIVLFDNQGKVLAAAGHITSTSTESRRVQLALKVNF